MVARVDPAQRLRTIRWSPLADLHESAARAIARVLSGEPAEKVIDRLLRSQRGLSGEQRTALVEAVFGVALWQRRLAWHAAVEPHPEHARALLFVLLRDLAGVAEAEAASLSGLSGAPPPPRDAPPSLALRWSLPDWIAASLSRDFGAEAEALCASLNLPGPICLRANTLRTTREALASTLRAEGVATRPTTFSPLGLLVEGPRPNILGLPSHRAGLFEVQDEGSQLLGLLVEARPGHTVLDFCAGRGGKTLLLAGELRGRGALLAHDVDQSRLDRLEQRAARAGVLALRVLRAEPDASLRCDRVLVDAPCSELGSLRRGPDARFRTREADALALPKLQLQILQTAARHVAANGLLIYATCTLRREENDEVVEAFLAAQPRFLLRTAGGPWLADGLRRGPYFESLPHRHGCDGFFAAVLQLA